MTVIPAPPITLIEGDFTGFFEIPASGIGVGDYMQTLGYNNFLLNAKCTRDANVFLQFSEDHTSWYTLRDKDWSDMLVEHVNGTVGAGGALISPSGQLQSVLIYNTHAINTLNVSFDNGLVWKAIPPNRHISVPTNAYSYQVKGSADGTTYEATNEYYLYGTAIKANENLTHRFYAGGMRYVRVVVQNNNTLLSLAANIDIKAMGAS